jgi:spore maturation protein CgeB
VRLFEAAACGCCIISDPWAGLDDVLEAGKEVLVAGSTEEVLALITRMPPERCTAVGRAARTRVLDEHSHIRRAEYLSDCLRESLELQSAAP